MTVSPAFGSYSQTCDLQNRCPRYSAATIAFFVISFVLALAFLALWFVKKEVAKKVAVPVTAFLFIWTGIGLALQYQIQSAGTAAFSMTHICVAAALLALVYNLNATDMKVKVVSKKKSADTAAPEGPTVVTEEPNV